MAGLTYAQMVTKIRNYAEVDSTVFTSTIVDGFILDAEERILRDVNTDSDRRYATSTMITSQKYLNFPTGALIIERFKLPMVMEIWCFYKKEIPLLWMNIILLAVQVRLNITQTMMTIR